MFHQKKNRQIIKSGHHCSVLLGSCTILYFLLTGILFADDSTLIGHPTNFNWHVNHASGSDNAIRAYNLDNSGIPDCGDGNALADTGNGFTCMTPAKGDTGSQGPQGDKGDKGDTGGSGGSSVTIGWGCRGECLYDS